MNVTRVRPLQGREWRQGTYLYGTWPAVYARHQPGGGKTEPARSVGILDFGALSRSLNAT